MSKKISAVKDLIKIYEKKIIDCDNRLKPLSEKLLELKQNNSDYLNLYHLKKERSIIIKVKKAAYIQAKKDIESLLNLI